MTCQGDGAENKAIKVTSLSLREASGTETLWVVESQEVAKWPERNLCGVPNGGLKKQNF